MTDYIARAKQSAKRAATALAVLSGIAAASAFAAPVSHAAVVQVGPGDSIVVEESDGYHPCTLGPYVVIDGTQFGALTAGHCGADGAPVYPTTVKCGDASCVYSKPIGTIYRPFEGKGNIDNTNGYDYALVKLDKSVMTDDGRVNGVKIDGALSLEAVSKLVDDSPNAQVCSMGRMSGYRCGTLVSATPNTGRIRTKMFAQKGDSGGPVWVNINGESKMIGTLQGGFGEGDSSTDTLVSPLDKPVTDYGLLYLNSYG